MPILDTEVPLNQSASPSATITVGNHQLRALYVFICQNNGVAPSGGDGGTWTLIDTNGAGSDIIELYRSLAPSVGNQTITGPASTFGYVLSIYDLDQTSPETQHTSGSGASPYTSSLTNAPAASALTISGGFDQAVGSFGVSETGETLLDQVQWSACSEGNAQSVVWSAAGGLGTLRSVRAELLDAVPPGPAGVKTIVGVAEASVKTVDSVAIASVKSLMGVA